MGIMEMLALILGIQVSGGVIFLGVLIWGMRHMAETRRRLDAKAADFDKEHARFLRTMHRLR
ncbi:hypothetical protein M2324_003999 [Rhodovulum sulfidophilum]|uniref:hypothetical protein n=1 Tax=Rhodovulum sulfidophilum TaxID=35806 RepID=UPI000B16CC27|nr:hypothetical protein [Rhodovulum sulfidophilum]MCW2305572.1 hypothetical protein [Rhodovulum sulfidophilum]